MLSDRTLTHTLGLPPRSVALWGDAVRGISIGLVALVLAGLTVVYAQALRNTVTLRHLQDFGVFFDRPRGFALGRTYTGTLEPSRATGLLNLNPPHFHLLLWPLTAFAPKAAFTIWMALSAVAGHWPR